MPIELTPLDPIVLRTVRLTCEQATRQATGIKVTDTWRSPVRDPHTGKFVPFRWFG